MAKKATVRNPGLKVTVPLRAEDLPRDLVPPEGPPGEPTIELVLEGGLTAQAGVSACGRQGRRVLTWAEPGPGTAH